MSEPLIAPLERLGLEVERLALAAEWPRTRTRRRTPWFGLRPGIVVALVLLLLALAAAALAASGLLSGAPVRNPPGFVYRSDIGVGTVVPGSVRLSALRVPDPAGGPPWGIRTLRTSRQTGCVQIGRVVDGQLGVLGQDGAFANDGKFHILPPDVLQAAECEPLDAKGHLFIAISSSGKATSGLSYGCTPKRISSGGVFRTRGPVPEVCPRADLRDIKFGALGPDGVATDHLDPQSGRVVTQRADGPDHAYLIVTRSTARSLANGGGWYTEPTPGSGLKAVRYADGTTCVVTSGRFAGGARPCPAKGYAEAQVSAAQLRTKITMKAGPPQAIPEPGADPAQPERPLDVTFRAPVATPDARAYYTVAMQILSRHGFAQCGWGGMSGPVAKTVARGELVRSREWIRPGCHALIGVTVRLHRASARNPEIDTYGGGRYPKEDGLVGTTTFRP